MGNKAFGWRGPVFVELGLGSGERISVLLSESESKVGGRVSVTPKKVLI